MIRKTLFITMLCWLTVAGSGCLPFPEVDELAFVVTLIIDKSDINKIKVGVKIPVPRLVGKVQGGAIGGGAGQEQLATITSTDAPTLLEGITAIQLFTGRQLNLEHARILLVGEALAREGIETEITSIMRYPQTRSNMNVIIVRGDAVRLSIEDQPEIEANIARFVNLQARSVDLNGLSIATQVSEFYHGLRGIGHDTVTGIWALNEKVLAARNATDREMAGGPTAPTENADADIAQKQEQRYGAAETGEAPEPLLRTTGSYEAGELPREGGNAVEWVGLAVFHKDRMVGELNGNESIAYRLLSGRLARATLTVGNTKTPSSLVTLEIMQARYPRIKITSTADGQINIDVGLYVEANLLSMIRPENEESTTILADFEEAVANSLQAWIDTTLKKTQAWGSDIYRFGEHYRRNFLTWPEWEKFNWSDHFKQAKVHVDIKVSIRRTGLITQTGPSK